MFTKEFAKDNSPILIWNDKVLNSRYNPVREGQNLADRFLTNFNDDKLLIYGLGFGYHCLPLLNEINEVIIFEPFIEVYNMAKTFDHLRELFQKAKVITSFSELQDYHLYKQFDFLPYTRYFSNEYNAFKAELERLKTQPKPKGNFGKYRVMIDFPIYGGSLTTATYVKNAFEDLGFVCETIDNTILEPFYKQVREFNNKKNMADVSYKLVGTLSTFLEAKIDSFSPDVVFFNAQSPITPEALTRIRQKGIFTIFWFVEDYSRLTYWKDYAKYFDLFITIQKEPFFTELNKIGCPSFLYLPMAACNETHKKLDLSLEERNFYGSDVSFMGAGYPNRRAFFENLLNFDLKIWGTDWDQNPKLLPFIQKNGERVSMEESVKIYNSTKININLHSSMDSGFFQQNGDFVNPRTFEILACGGFQLVDRRSLLTEHFKDGEHLVVFDSLNDLKDKISYFLRNENERKQIAENGRKFVLEKHTYSQRISDLFKTLEEQIPFFKKFKNVKNEVIKKVNIKELLAKEGIYGSDFNSIISEINNRTGKFTEVEKKMLLLNSFLTGE